MARKPRAPRVPEVEPEGLSPQQKEIWRLAREQKTAKEIAQILGTSYETVRNQLHRILLAEDVNKNILGVSHALDAENIQTLLDRNLPLQDKVEILLTRTGHLSQRAVAEHLGTTYGSVRVMLTRMRRSQAKGKPVRRQATEEELRAAEEKLSKDPELLVPLTYEVFVRNDADSPAGVPLRRLLAALGAGGTRVQREARRDRGQKLKRLLAEPKGVLKTAGRAAWKLLADIITEEFAWVDDLAWRPRREASPRALREAAQRRFELISAGKIAIEATGRREQGLPVYRLQLLDEVAAAVRKTEGGLLVAEARRTRRGAGKVLKGVIEEIREGAAVLKTCDDAKREVSFLGLAVEQGRARWEVSEAGLAGPGDEACAARDGWLVVKSRNIEVVVLPPEEVARFAAAFRIGESCVIELEEGLETRRWRVDLAGAEKLVAVELAALTWEPDAEDDAEVVKVVPERGAEGTKYRVVAGATKVAEAAARCVQEIPVVVQHVAPKRAG